MASFSYVYILESERFAASHYVGVTDDLRTRIRSHNAGNVRHTSKFVPWVVKSAIALRDRDRAIAFERYLKTHAGRKFIKAHL